MTICVLCEHHRLEGDPKHWGSHVCAKEKQQEYVDPVTGMTFVNPLPYCRDINKGNCPFYEGKK